MVSPLNAEELAAAFSDDIIPAPSLIAALSNESLVRVDGSKKIQAIILSCKIFSTFPEAHCSSIFCERIKISSISSFLNCLADSMFGIKFLIKIFLVRFYLQVFYFIAGQRFDKSPG